MGSIEEPQLPTSPSTTPSGKLFSWTVCAYRKPGLTEEAYHKYMSEIHAPLAKVLLKKYGMIRWSMTHNTSDTKGLMKQIAGPQFNNFADYDCIIQVVFPDISNFVELKKDPYYREKVAPDHENFADTEKSRMSVGWIEDHLRNGEIVYE